MFAIDNYTEIRKYALSMSKTVIHSPHQGDIKSVINKMLQINCF